VTGRGVRRYLDDLLRGDRPRPFRAAQADAEELRAAIELRAARPGDDDPREGFVDELHQRLTVELAGPRFPRPGIPVLRRRLVAQGAAVAGAAAVVGAAAGMALDRVLTDRDEPGPGAGTVTPTTGAWQTVAAGSQLPEGAVRAFDLGAVAGFVQRTGGLVQAVSGSCTHQGCRLRLDTAARNLDCPCHTTVFALTGELITHQLPVAPPRLPRFETREIDGAVQVFAPRTWT
jgi:cytochrome b6-f complex iron-sulfur subunit